jgi:tol-pal system protein YbgF
MTGSHPTTAPLAPYLRSLRRAALALAPAFLAMALVLPAPVAAQDLARQIELIKRDLADLQRFIYNGQQGTPPALSSTDGAAASGDDAMTADAAARLQVRLQALEESVRRLTGQVEEAQFGVRRLNDRLDTALQDIDFRLTRLEGGETGAPPASASARNSGSAGAQPVIPVPGQGQQSGGSGTTVISSAGTETQSGQQGGTLGTLIVDAQGNVIGGQANPAATQGSAPQASGSGASEPPSPSTVAQAAPVEGGDLDQGGGTQTAALPDTPQELYDHSLGLMRQGEYADAETALRTFLERFPQDERIGAALYWLGETHYVRNDYREAALAFVEVYRKHKSSSKAPDSVLKLGMALHARGDANEACAALQTLQNEFPDARRAVLKLAEDKSAEYGC